MMINNLTTGHIYEIYHCLLTMKGTSIKIENDTVVITTPYLEGRPSKRKQGLWDFGAIKE